MLECWTPEREVGGSNLLPPCCVLEQDTLLYTVAWWLTPRIRDPDVGGSDPTRVAVLCP